MEANRRGNEEEDWDGLHEYGYGRSSCSNSVLGINTGGSSRNSAQRPRQSCIRCKRRICRCIRNESHEGCKGRVLRGLRRFCRGFDLHICLRSCRPRPLGTMSQKQSATRAQDEEAEDISTAGCRTPTPAAHPVYSPTPPLPPELANTVARATTPLRVHRDTDKEEQGEFEGPRPGSSVSGVHNDSEAGADSQAEAEEVRDLTVTPILPERGARTSPDGAEQASSVSNASCTLEGQRREGIAADDGEEHSRAGSDEWNTERQESARTGNDGGVDVEELQDDELTTEDEVRGEAQSVANRPVVDAGVHEWSDGALDNGGSTGCARNDVQVDESKGEDGVDGSRSATPILPRHEHHNTPGSKAPETHCTTSEGVSDSAGVSSASEGIFTASNFGEVTLTPRSNSGHGPEVDDSRQQVNDCAERDVFRQSGAAWITAHLNPDCVACKGRHVAHTCGKARPGAQRRTMEKGKAKDKAAVVCKPKELDGNWQERKTRVWVCVALPDGRIVQVLASIKNLFSVLLDPLVSDYPLIVLQCVHRYCAARVCLVHK